MYKNFFEYQDKPLKYDNNKINICIFYYDDVTFYLRLQSIFDIISKNPRYAFYIVFPKDLKDLQKDLSENKVFFDYFIIQRNWLDLNISKTIMEKSKKLKYKVIFEIDDDLINMDKSNPGYPYFKEIRNDLIFLVKNADVVSVSTKHLEHSLKEYNENIIVIPNRLIDLWFGNRKIENSSNEVIKIGYMGSIYHSWDLILIKEAIESVKSYFSKKNITVVFELIGGSKDEISFANRIEVPENSQPYFDFVKWFVSTVDWDLAIAPLEESNLNNAKSELKYLEYSVLGIPGIYSSIGPYKECISHEKNGLLVYSNSPDEWTENIIRLIEDENLRSTIIKNSYEDIKSNYLIEESVNQWIDLFEMNYNEKTDNKIKKYLKKILFHK